MLGLQIRLPQRLLNDLELLLGVCHSLQEGWKVDCVKNSGRHDLVKRLGRRHRTGHHVPVALGQRLCSQLHQALVVGHAPPV